jgi:hypothetical protein
MACDIKPDKLLGRIQQHFMIPRDRTRITTILAYTVHHLLQMDSVVGQQPAVPQIVDVALQLHSNWAAFSTSRLMVAWNSWRSNIICIQRTHQLSLAQQKEQL